ncbi:hypothetical protein BGZ73_002547 [Actinomortierella ambigua]|nr:hypothetical protein BGZ73_002547 [Actinomortierella ambigua]
MSSPAPDSAIVSAAATSPATTVAEEEESILSFLTTDFLESQTTTLPFDGPHAFFDNLTASAETDQILKYEYEDLLHPPSPPTSNGTFSDTSGSPLQAMVDSCDEGSTSDVPMETTNALEYWQYVYADLARQQQDQQKLATSTQPGAWPLLSLATPSDPSLIAIQPKLPLLRPALAPNGVPATILPSLSKTAAPLAVLPNPSPPSPNASVKSERVVPDKPEKKATKRAKKNNGHSTSATAAPSPASSTTATTSPLLPSKTAPAPAPLAPAPVALKPLLPLAPAPPSPPMTAHDAASSASNQRPLAPISPAIQPVGVRRTSIVPALTPSPARSSTVVVKSAMVTEEKPQSEAALTAQAKRQERLIKNRAAALLSRKRKREHISLLESHTDQLKTENQELKEKVTELEENVKTLTFERDAARREVDRLTRQVTILTGHRLDTKMEIDLERNTRLSDSERVLNSKATGMVFMIILFSFALFTLPSRKLDTLMVGGSMERPRIGASIVGRTLDTYTKNPTIAGQMQEIKTTGQGEGSKNGHQNNNHTDLIVFSDNHVLQSWLGHHRLPETASANTGAIPRVVVSPPGSAAVADGETKSVGFVDQTFTTAQPWDMPEDDIMDERDALLYCANLVYSFPPATLVRPAGTARTKDGRVRSPRFSIYSPVGSAHGQEGSATGSSSSANDLPPWMPKSTHDETNSKQKFLRLDFVVTSSRIVSGKNLMDQEQIIHYSRGAMDTFGNKTPASAAAAAAAAVASFAPSSDELESSMPTLPSHAKATPMTGSNELPPSWQQRIPTRPQRSSRVNERGGVTKTGQKGAGNSNRRPLYRRNNIVAQMAARAIEEKDLVDDILPVIKEEPVEIFIKEEPMD